MIQRSFFMILITLGILVVVQAQQARLHVVFNRSDVTFNWQIKSTLVSVFFNPIDNYNRYLNEGTIIKTLSSFGLAVEGVVEQQNLTVYPNPVVDEVNISFSSFLNETVSLSISTLKGHEVMTTNIEVVIGINQIQLISDILDKGIYLLHLKSDNVAARQKIQVLE